MLRVYTASKITTGKLWRQLHNEWPEVYFHARWLKHNVLETEDTIDNAGKFWQEDVEDIKSSDYLIIYAILPEEHLRGALVEAGVAIGEGIPVLIVGEHADYGTWQYHPLCQRVPTLAAARAFFREELRLRNRLQT
jgi:nucleoside 2-deoxyribosyltransferase